MKKHVLAIVTALTLSIGMFASSTSAQEPYNAQSDDPSLQISKSYDLSVVELQQLNELKSTIYSESTSSEENKVQDESDDGTHLIKNGDTLFSIAVTYGISVADLKEWNNLSSDLIYVDEKLAIEASAAKARPSTTAYSPPESKPSSTPASDNGQTYTMRATAYTAYCTGCSGITANGTDLRSNPNQKVIAVDPRVIPLGTKVWVEGYGEAIAADTGGAIKGNKIDVFIPTDGQARNWGVRTVSVKILN